MRFKLINLNFYLISYIDEGKNPLLFTKDCLIETLKKNEEIKGKIVTFGNFHDMLLEELEKNFPKDYQIYRKYRQENQVKEKESE